MEANIPVAAGAASTVIFVLSTMPMLIKAARTRDLASYSLGNILLSNLGNATYSVYVFTLPPGPVWVLHTFYVVSTGLMLFWYVRYRRTRRPDCTEIPIRSVAAGLRFSSDAPAPAAPYRRN
jgi:uncharacterized protein with PQ loop repeat